MTDNQTRGRPSAPECDVRDKVLNTAFILIVERDMASLTIDEIAKRGGLAKKTIYKFFSNKDAIVEGMIAKWTSTSEVVAPALPATEQEVIALLEAFFITLMHRVLSLESVVIYQFLQGELKKKAEYLKLYRANGFDTAGSVLDGWLNAVRAAGLLNPLWPANSAVYLQSLIVTPLLRDISLGILPPVPTYNPQPRIAQILQDFSPMLLASRPSLTRAFN